MHVPVEQTLIQNTKFRAVLVFGVMCTLVALVLRAIVNQNGDNCVYDDYCNFSYNSNVCIQNGNIYCCGAYGYDYCGSNSHCYKQTSSGGYLYCGGMVTTYWIFSGIAILVWIVMIVMAHQHRKQMQMIGLIPANINPNHIVYSDPVQPIYIQNPQVQVQPSASISNNMINESVSSNNYRA